MADLRSGARGSRLSRNLPAVLTLLACLLTIVWLQPEFPFLGQDSAWPLALNQAVSDRLAFGHDILFNLGPWSAVYTGQFHPATDGMMIFGGAVVALSFGAGLIALAPGGRGWLLLLAPLLIASVGLRDPVFVALPLLLLVVAVSQAQPASFASSIPHTAWNAGVLLALTCACALLSFVKSTFGTQSNILILLALIALIARRRHWLAVLALACYLASLVGFWLAAGQRMGDLPGFFAAVPLLIGGYTEGMAKTGPWSDIAAYLSGAAVLLALFWCDRARRGAFETLLVMTGLSFTIFVALKSGFIRHDEHALIAAGSLALLPLVLINMWRWRSLAIALVVTLSVLTFISQHYPGYNFPSATRTGTRLAAAAEGAWTRVTEPTLLTAQYDSRLAQIAAALPLAQVTGPTDIYSSGQAILIANKLDWSPRPALQSVTVTSPEVDRADLNHLEGNEPGGHSVQNVFFMVENVDNRVPTLEEGMSWPALLSQYHAAGYDRGLDLALFQRDAGTTAATAPGPIFLQGQYRLGQEVDLPVLPDGLAWAKLDVRQTLAGRLASFLLRPPALFLTIRYANGEVERYRFLSALGRSGFLLTPPIASTADMLRLLLPDRKDSERRPVSAVLSGESGTRFLWAPEFSLQLQPIAIPYQPQVRAMVVVTPQPQTEPLPAMNMADFCEIDWVGKSSAPAQRIMAKGETRITGAFVAVITTPHPPEQFFVRLTNPAGQSWVAPATPKYRADVAGYFLNQALVRAGFDTNLDLSSFSGPYTLSLEAAQGSRRWQCKLRQKIVISPPGYGEPR